MVDYLQDSQFQIYIQSLFQLRVYVRAYVKGYISSVIVTSA